MESLCGEVAEWLKAHQRALRASLRDGACALMESMCGEVAEWLKAHQRALRASLRDGACALWRACAERWPSGLRRTLGKRVYGKPYRGFESHPLRHHAEGSEKKCSRFCAAARGCNF